VEPHVFVVMPFGVKEARAATPATENSPAQTAIDVDFDNVYQLLVAPALKKAGCVPFRADQEKSAGDIRTDMYFELVTADVVLADISILNPNVFYELGIRHAAASRGVLMIHGGWSRRPFDVAPDRTFDYDGQLFVSKALEGDEALKKRLDAEADRMAKVIRDALAVDEQTVGSPVYKELVGLVPPDWSKIQTARAKYFGDVFTDWKNRVELAKLNGWPGDVLTLADDAPTRFHRSQLLWEAAFALISMQRFDVAKSVLEDLLSLNPRHLKALTQYGLVLSRLGKINDAKVHMLNVAEQHKGDTEAHGILGRVYKDLWRLEWINLKTLEERQQQAVLTSGHIAESIYSYDLAARRHFDYYNGINVVSLLKLLEHLKEATGNKPADTKINDVDSLISLVRFASQNALDCAAPGDGEAVWATATLGELELMTGDAETAREIYSQAAYGPDATYFQVSSMLDQIYLFESLDFRPAAVAGVKQVLEKRRNALEEKIGRMKKSEPRFKKVILASGHMIDAPDRVKKGLERRFPPEKEGVVREHIAGRLKSWNVGKGDLAICGGARGADILFAELCADLEAEVWIFLALPEADFLQESVRLPASDWQDRFYALRDREGVKLFNQSDRLKSPPKGTSPFLRNNIWMINTARVEANDPKNLYAILVWDQKPSGDGPGGTSDFEARVRQLGGRLVVIDPTKL
jgi:tetratricopeptide (TPR) repeat protein